MKTLKDLTPKIQAKIPEYIERAVAGVFDGKRYNDFTLEKAEKAVNWNYKFCGYKEPVVIVAENPYEAQVFFNYIKGNEDLKKLILLLYKLKAGKIDLKQIKLDLPSDSQLASQLNSQLNSQFDSQLHSQLRRKLHSQLYSQLDDQLNDQLYDQLYDQLNDQLYDQLHSQFDSQLHSQLRRKLHSQLHSQLDSQLRSQLDNQLISQLISQLHSQLRRQLYSQLDSQQYSHLRSQLYSQSYKYNSDYLFTLNVYSNCYYNWFSFIKNEFNLPLSVAVEKEFEECFKVQRESGIYSAIFSEILCIVSKYPKKVYRNEDNDLHNINGPAIEWSHNTDETKFDCFFINGRVMPSKIFTEAFDKNDFLKESNEDIKAGMYEIIEGKGEGNMLKFLNAEKVHEQTFVHDNGELEKMELYKTKEKFEEEENLDGECPSQLAWLKMKCPSTGAIYLIPSDSSFDKCEDAAKYHRPDYVEKTVPYSWEQRS